MVGSGLAPENAPPVSSFVVGEKKERDLKKKRNCVNSAFFDPMLSVGQQPTKSIPLHYSYRFDGVKLY